MITEELLVSSASVKSPSTLDSSGYGEDGGGTLVSVGTMSCRVTRNRSYETTPSNSQGPAGYLTGSTHVIFCQVQSFNIKVGYTITVNGTDYMVEYVDSCPGGISDHWQIYASAKVR